MVARVFTILITMVFLVGFTGCRFDNSHGTKLQYMPDMADNPTVKAQENYLDPPEGSVPINGILYPATVQESSKALKNPYPVSDAIVTEGKEIWGKFCITCHGPNAQGKNALRKSYPPVPDITEGSYAEYTDGHVFHRITFGAALMPGYGHAISADERWKLVHYLRQLQQKG